MQILNIAGYKFIGLNTLPEHSLAFLTIANDLNLKGTILLSSEGINISLAGQLDEVQQFVTWLHSHEEFSDMRFRESYSTNQPFKHMRVKIKKEIITLQQPDVDAVKNAAPALTPKELEQWLDEKRDMTLLDTRNNYEVRFGTFENAKNLVLDDFGQFPEAMSAVPRDKPIVMFCTGGIRCEKAALVMMNAGYENVYQLEGGILNYFKEVGGKHYQGECFVFDQRISVDTHLQETGTIQCQTCQGPRVSEQSCSTCCAT